MRIHTWLNKHRYTTVLYLLLLANMRCESMIHIRYQTFLDKESRGEIYYNEQKKKICKPSKDYGPDGIYFCSPYHIFTGQKMASIAHANNVPINYHGTDKNWHFFDIEEKIGGGKPGEVFSFAVKANECKTIEGKTHAEIAEMTGESNEDRHYHTLLNMKGQCVIFL